MSTETSVHFKEKLTGVRVELIEVLESLTEEQLQEPIISEAQIWTTLDIVAHLLENERAMSIHVHKIRKGRETVPAEFDLEKWNAGWKERTGTRSLQALLADLSQTRLKTFEVLASINDDEWALSGRHPQRQMITIEQYYNTIADHDVWHLNDIKTALDWE